MRVRRCERPRASSQRGHWAWWAAPLALIAASALWFGNDELRAAASERGGPAAAPAPTTRASSPVGSASAGAAAVPFSAAGLQAREAQRALWQQRLERAQAALDAYRASTHYPYESRPIAEHPDQAYPNQPIAEDHTLRAPGGKAADGVSLRTTQERVFVQGQESVRFTIALRDANGQALPLRVLRAAAREIPPPNTGSLYPVVPLDFNDDGAGGDTTAGDRVFSVLLQPATQGFAGLFGQIRVDAFLEHRNQQGQTYFDIFYTPDPPATWQGGVRETLEEGSLNFYLKAQVREAGRYVVTGRIDDANGKPFALLTFNDEVATGAQEFRLSLFGKLVHDGKPAFPLTLRDVDAFRLREDSFPDRSLMPRLAGRVHTSGNHALGSFADAEWSGEERTRYLTELNRDLGEAQDRVEQLKGP